MPTRAGASDKAGNRYEYLWTVDHLLRILTDEVVSLTLEPLQQGESDGIEFIATMQDRTNEYWSIKRQTTASGWTLSALTSPNSTGRSILGDLFKHVRADDLNRAVFASTLGAGDFAELRELADEPALFEERLTQSLNLRTKFNRHLLPLAGGHAATALKLLERTRSHTIDETLFRKSLYESLRRTLYKDSEESLDPAEVYGLLADHVSQQVHRRIDRAHLIEFLGAHNLRVRNWATETTVQQRVRDLCDEYVKPIQQEWLNSDYVSIPVDEAILDPSGQPRGSKILVVAGAGSGKSSTLANIVRKLQETSIPVLPIRFDQVDEGIMSTGELGRRLSLPESPALVLAGIASGERAALVVDQLDAVSIASGRRVDLWNIFDGLRRELSQFPNLTLIVGCRQFDLDHDPRMRAMKANQAGFTLVHLKPLTAELVESILNSAGIAPSTIEPNLRELLTLPFHLSMFLSISSSGREGVLDQDDLFDHFWTDAQQRVNHRAGRNVQWVGVLDRLSVWLSNHQRLSAPQNVLEELEADAAVLASERILIHSNRQYRFFHELFFDYVFARRFFSAGRNVVDFLLSDEQHLFRRAQVRQILMYIRQQDRQSYFQELRATLLHPGVRFHIKQLIFQVLRSLLDPTLDEWRILQDFGASYPDLQLHLRGVTYGQVAWFDIQRSAGYFDRIFSGHGTEQQQLDAISLMNARDILRARAPEVRAILFAYKRPGDQWDNIMVQICRSGEFHHDRQLFDAFLDLIRRGKIGNPDGSSPHASELHYLLHAATEDRPALAAEATAVWLAMMHQVWTERNTLAAHSDGPTAYLDRFHSFIDRNGMGTGWISEVAADFRSFVQHLFPVVVNIIRSHSHNESSYLASDDTWTFRFYGHGHLQFHSELFDQLALSMERLANADPEELDRVLTPHIHDDSDPIAYLWLRAKSANPARYAEEIATYLAEDDRRLKVGYSSWSIDGNAEDLISIQAVRICSPTCSEGAFRALEQTILRMKDSPGRRWRGARQVRLLEALQASRRSQAANTLYAELDRKFPNREREAPKPEDDSLGWVGSPISQDAQERMSDEQWIGAFRKYQNKQFKSTLSMAGGERELAQALESRAKEAPARFCGLARTMPDDLAPAYFEAIIRGVTAWGQNTTVDPELLEATCDLIHRVHDLPNRPSGRWLCWLIQSWKTVKWPDDIVDIVSWYAVHDGDPNDGSKRMFPSGNEHGFGAFEEGMNTTRGSAALAIATVLFKNPDRIDLLATTLQSLASDRTLHVRACTVTALMAALNSKPDQAVLWFKASLLLGSDLLDTYHVERFVYFAYRNNPVETQPILDAMFQSTHEKVRVAASRLACSLSLIDHTAQPFAGRAKCGSSAQREAGVRVYAEHIDHESFGEVSREHVKQFFHDEEPSVKLRAAGAFRKLSGLTTLQQQDLIEAFLSSGPGPLAIQILLDALDDSPVAFPDLVLKVAQRCATEVDPSDSTQRAHRVSMELPKIVVRLLVQSQDPKMRADCLDLIDDMGKRFFLGISDELQRAVR